MCYHNTAKKMSQYEHLEKDNLDKRIISETFVTISQKNYYMKNNKNSQNSIFYIIS